jgi:hypothetical protein
LRPAGDPELRRRLLLSCLVLGWGEAHGHPLPGQAAALATALARSSMPPPATARIFSGCASWRPTISPSIGRRCCGF